MRRPSGATLALCLLAPLASCDRPRPVGTRGPGPNHAGGAVAEASPVDEARVVAGQTVYVPVYSSVYISDRAQEYTLGVTLSVRNTDRAHPVVVNAVRYHDQDGRLVRDYLAKPLRIGPLASTNFYVRESDTSGGVSACFLVDWVAEHEVTAPVIESVMVGTSGQQGISLTSPGRVLQDRAPRAPRGAGAVPTR